MTDEDPVDSFAVAVEHRSRMDDLEACAFAVSALNALVHEGFSTRDRATYKTSDAAVIARNEGGDIVGVIVFHNQATPPRTFIALGFVSPSWRRHGVYTRLYNKLVTIARGSGSTSIESEVHPDNINMLKIAESQGRYVSRLIVRGDM